ncbi:alpha/beta hydrolase [Desertivirga arenae]|uniref:alpha/beta hydrolase n=1 Tax=Desertivirga arenae TaxID=2810309 RepID=UPI001A977C14|nr:alpha/beta hydrolase [Pedobacter sp. SYSU D00823]
MQKSFVIALFTAIFMNASSQTVIPLYPGKIPNAIEGPDEELKNINNTGQVRYEKVSKPGLEIFLPKKNKSMGAAVVIIPGGGYRHLSYSHEGTNIAAEFNKMGIAAFVLKYRLPSDKTMPDKSVGPLQDAQQAIKTVRSRAREWGIDTGKVGIVGFSAGGHLASTAGTHFNKAVIDNKENINLRPDFMVLVYPVISLSETLMHKGSRDNLIGTSPSAELTRLYSNELQVSPQTPPTMLIHAGDDKTVKVQNSIRFYEALLQNNVSAEMHIYPKGGHGFGLAQDRAPDHWTDRVENWLKGLGFIKK